ncbi:TPA: hypothetical protein QDC55_003290 [Burkholderia cenocepacia]|nr:hypothetical protein [Burkholderia cenocepacia]HDR9810210.1 hypothetical protein [Burkholderia cenocepacia]HDR9817980.1 hypothetical protein [Burkholderia cenocepacia]HDR9829725.1 hypothetical protein [Burkholderia cenocepacia]
MNNLRCRPGDLARIKSAWNTLLIGKIVLVRSAYTDSEWLVTLLDNPALTIRENRTGFVVTRAFIADDWSLEPLRGVEQANEQHEESAFQRMHSAEDSLQDMGGA